MSMRLAHVMLRVNDLEQSIEFYTRLFGMKLQRRSENTQYRYTLAFLGYGDTPDHETVLELTYNWDRESYQHGEAFGHLCFEVGDVYAACERISQLGGEVTRLPGPVKGGSTVIAFVRDPNGYQIELI